MGKRSKKRKAAPSRPASASAPAEVPKKNRPPRPAPAVRAWWNHPLLLGAILVVSVFIVYLPVRHALYLWDDDQVITANPCVVGMLGLKGIWTTSFADICPLTLTTFWIGHALWGLNPLPYHLLNVVMHAGAAVLLWRVLLALQIPGAWWAAALWSLHPQQVESVAWCSELKNTQSVLFYLSAILFFVKAQEGRASFAWIYLFAAGAIASKSSTMILPFILPLCAWWMEGRWNWRQLPRLLPILLMSLASGLLSTWTQKLAGAQDPFWARSFPARLVSAGKAIWFYLGKIVWPDPLVVIYPKWPLHPGEVLSYLPLAAALALFAFLWWKHRSAWARPFFFAYTYFLIAIGPTLGVISLSYFANSYAADHFQYLAAMGPIALIAAGGAWCARIATPEWRWAPPSLGVIVLLILAALSNQRAVVFQTEQSLWADTLEKNPNTWTGLNDMAVDLAQKNHPDLAIQMFRQAIAIYPRYSAAYNNLGLLLGSQDRLEEARDDLEKSIEYDPKNLGALNNYGNILARLNRPDEAIKEFYAAENLLPSDAAAFNNMGTIYLNQGKLDLALPQLQQAEALSPQTAKIHYNLALVYQRKNQLDAAEDEYRRSLALAPRAQELHDGLGQVLLRENRRAEAIQEFQIALQLAPNQPEIQRHLQQAMQSSSSSSATP